MPSNPNRWTPIVVLLAVFAASIPFSRDSWGEESPRPGQAVVPAESDALDASAHDERDHSVTTLTGSEQLAQSDSDEDGIVRLESSLPKPIADSEDEEDALLREIRTLRKRLEKLESSEKKRADGDAKKKADEAKKKEDELKKAADWVDMSNDKWTVRLGGIVQMDYINWANADPAIRGPAANPGTKDYFEFRRLRLSAEGTGYGVLDFRLQLTLEPETVGESPPGTVVSPDIKDAYFSMNEIPWLGRFRIGNFFVPFGLEQVTNDSYGVFMERSIPTQGLFTGDREVGVALYNCTEDKRVTWTGGMFLDSVSEALKERIDDNQGYRMSGRLTWLPYYDEPSNGRYLVHTGVGVLHTQDQDNRVRFRTRPEIHEGPRLIDSGVISATKYTAANVEGAVVMGPFAVQSEGYICQVQRFAADPVTLHGAYAHMTYFLTGENRKFEPFGIHGAQFGRNVPHSNFFLTPGGHGSGAWELKARWSYVNLDAVNRGRLNDMTFGVNWYWTDRTRVMFDWIHPMTSGDTTFGATKSDLLATRFDFNW